MALYAIGLRLETSDGALNFVIDDEPGGSDSYRVHLMQLDRDCCNKHKTGPTGEIK